MREISLEELNISEEQFVDYRNAIGSVCTEYSNEYHEDYYVRSIEIKDKDITLIQAVGKGEYYIYILEEEDSLEDECEYIAKEMYWIEN